MSINTAFYQIAEDVTAADLAKIIGATDLCGPDQIVIRDIEPFDAAKPFSLIYQSDPDLAKTLAVESAIVITNEACLPLIDPANCCLIVASPRIGFAHALAHLVTMAPVDHGTAGIAPTGSDCQHCQHSPISDHHAASCDRGGNRDRSGCCLACWGYGW